jgi:hypothetical protein
VGPKSTLSGEGGIPVQKVFDMTFKFLFYYEKRISPRLDRGKRERGNIRANAQWDNMLLIRPNVEYAKD